MPAITQSKAMPLTNPALSEKRNTTEILTSSSQTYVDTYHGNQYKLLFLFWGNL